MRWTLLPAGAAGVFFCLATFTGARDVAGDAKADTQLRAMVDELDRSKKLQLSNLEKPYFLQYAVSDTEQSVITASLGGIVSSSRAHVRQPRIEVRVGDYKFDNTHSIFSINRHLGLFPIDEDYGVMRTDLWLATDGLYKAAADQITRKRTVLREIASPDQTPDLAPAKPVQILRAPPAFAMDQGTWERLLRQASAVFGRHPGIGNSSAKLTAVASTYRLANTEGTVIRVPQQVSYIDLHASGYTADGSRVWSDRFVTAFEISELPKQGQLEQAAEALAQEIEALQKAPLAEDYSGPVLFEEEAAPEMMAAVLGEALRVQRRPVTPPNFDAARLPILDSPWAGRLGTKVLPEWMNIYDDPHEKTALGAKLTGQYDVDDEGVPVERVELVQKGILKSYLMSREPVRELNASNGHGRLPGNFGGEMAVIGNLFVQAEKTVPERKMKARLLQKAKAAGLKYGVLVRKLDFPSTANLEELQSVGRQLRKNGASRSLNIPVLAYRVYPDGREELVRGFRFRQFSGQELSTIDAASDTPRLLNYLNNGTGLNSMALESSATTSSVICPSLLLGKVDMARAEDEAGKLPSVPAPPIEQ